MKNINAEIGIDITRLNFPLRTLYARRLCAFRASLNNIPGDLVGVFLRILSADGSSYRDFAAVPSPDPTRWLVTIPAFALAEVGPVFYEIHAEADSEKYALGRGTVAVNPFTAGGEAPAPGTPIQVAQMPTKDGGWVNCIAVMDETGEYTYEFERIEEDA
jgi:hypothetical protein